MLATHCTFCQHENTPGARFCAECGSPLHLKVCANPQCGKVSEVSATICETCGQPFPRIDLVAPGTGDVPPAAGAAVAHSAPDLTPPPASATTEKPRTALWPLIAVAIAAGALPLLWANRAYIPAPKSGPFSNPEITKPAPSPTAAAPAPAPVVPTSPPAADPPATPPTVATASELDPASPGPAAKAGSKPERPPAKKPAAPRECTEALAALGLCTPKQAGK